MRAEMLPLGAVGEHDALRVRLIRVVIGGHQQRRPLPGLRRQTAPHIEYAPGINIVKAGGEQHRYLRRAQRIAGVGAAPAGAPESILSLRVPQHLVQIRRRLTQQPPGELRQRQCIKGIGVVTGCFQRFALIHTKIPIAVQPDLKAAVAVGDVIPFAVLHVEYRPDNIRGKGRCGEMGGGQIADAIQQQLPVVEGLLPHPRLQPQPVLPFVDIGDAIAGAFSPPPALLKHHPVARLHKRLVPGGVSGNGFLLGHGLRFVHIRVPNQQNRAALFILRQQRHRK